MASWAKNQISKQLAKFAKNVDPNSISLKFLKGEGELTNLELDEAVLSDLLEFPPWVQLTKVTCNRISARVPWTTLKSDPIKLLLDQVEVIIEASENLATREKSKNLPALNNTKPGKYGFAEKVVDGMYVAINTLNVSFITLGFKASVIISRIIVQSTTPDWKPAKNLRLTRVKDEVKGEVLTFKEIKWGTMRLDADAAYKPESKEIPSTPLRLITNNSTIRLVIKKRLADCSMVASKLIVILDDILWVLTRSQLLKLSSFVHYMVKLRSKYLPLAHESVPVQTPQPTQTTQQTLSQDQLFSAYDLPETSFHLRTHRIDLHLCDDSTLQGNNPEYKNTQSAYDESGAALQISLMSVAVDHCPYHLAGTKRTVIKSDEEVTFQRMRWAHQLMNNFQETEGKSARPRKSANTFGNMDSVVYRKPIMYESFTVVNCQDFQIMQVTTAKSKEVLPFLSSEKEALYLPKEMAAIHVDHTAYYYCGGNDLPVPAPNIFVQVNPVQLTFNPLTCVWLNRFAQSVMSGLEWTKEFLAREPGFVEHVNVRIEALMPKIRVPIINDESKPHLEERPTCMQIQVSQAVISNCRIGAKCSQTDVLNDLQNFIGSRLYADMSCFPNEKNDITPLSNSSWLNDFSVNHYQISKMTKKDKELYSRLARDDNLPHEIWCVSCDQVWIEFLGTPKLGTRPTTFVDAFPLRLWICQNVPYYEFTGSSETSSYRGSDVGTVDAAEEVFDESRSSKPANNRLLDMASGGWQQNSSQNLAPNGYNRENNDGHNIRTSHSESDLLNMQAPNATAATGSASAQDINYAQGGPPPPYYSSESQMKNHNLTVSMNSLPPAYEYTAAEDPGPLEKPPITDFVNYDEVHYLDNSSANVAILMNIEKSVCVQLDHFQLLFLLRTGEVIESMMERITMDNLQCEKERAASLTQYKDVEQSRKVEETFILNAHIPEVIVDLVLPPCIGIDPIQRLPLPDRIVYEKEKEESITESLKYESILPLRKISVNKVSESFSENISTTQKRPIENNVFTGDNLKLHIEPDDIINSRENPEYFDEKMYEENYKEVKDAEVQVGNSLMSVNLKPRVEDQLVSVLRIQANIMTLTVQNKGDNGVVKIAAETICLNELGNMKYGKVLDPRGHTPTRDPGKQQVNMNTITGDCVFKMRLVSGPHAENIHPGSEKLGFADIRVKSVIAALLMTTIDNLAEFAEDEFILPMMPFTVDISDSDISLYDDKPRRYKSAVKLPPMQILLSGMTVERNLDGVMKLNYKPPTQTSNDETIPSEINDSLNARSRNNSIIADSINQQVDALISENGRLLDDLKVVNAKVNGLHNERESLIKVIDKLQKELMHSNRENDDLHMRVRTLSLKAQKGHSS